MLQWQRSEIIKKNFKIILIYILIFNSLFRIRSDGTLPMSEDKYYKW